MRRSRGLRRDRLGLRCGRGLPGPRGDVGQGVRVDVAGQHQDGVAGAKGPFGKRADPLELRVDQAVRAPDRAVVQRAAGEERGAQGRSIG